ncbi:MAG: redoxin family protein [Candidatus Pacebacteria bacterium]|nr:redoxin family protein [Candidatus Paceibacterota bacterium]MCF7862728.1 redoxin family protein [Candidatus Paceibacterota bacterium]
MFLLLISFLGGVLTVLAPCILPLLPVIVGGSFDDTNVNKKKALTIVLSLGVSVILFTFILKVSTAFIDIPEYTWKLISGSIVLFLGITTLFPSLWENKFLAKLSARSNILLGKGNQKNNFWGDVIVGASLGPIFSTCSPTYFIVLATVLPVSFFLGTIYLLAYVLGLCLSLFLIAILGQKLVQKLGFSADPNGIFKKVLAVLFILVGISILTGLDKKIETSILNGNYFDVTKIEQALLEKKNEMEVNQSNEEINSEIENKAGLEALEKIDEPTIIKKKGERPLKAPEFSSIDGYINTEGKIVTLESLKGKIVLLDIWTYSCINCQRTLPYLNSWYEKYRENGLEIVGLHTPEFSFEKNKSNVENAVKKFGIKYPVFMDNDYSTWRALGNQYWPRKYLIDAQGYIIYDHIGEGAYEETEKAIQEALSEINTEKIVAKKVQAPNIVDVNSRKIKSHETYFGYSRNEYLSNGVASKSGEQNLYLPENILPNKLYLDGTWFFSSEYAENLSNALIVFNFEAKNVYMTAESEKGVDIEIYKDNVFVKKINIKNAGLYDLISGEDYNQHTLKIKALGNGLKAFTFTFG